MVHKRSKPKPPISMAAIRRYARKIVERFEPDKIFLFGSYAYGTPNADSDVDLMVIMPCYNQLTQGARITLALDAPFPLDLLVCKPERWKLRVEDGESFVLQILGKGKVLYEKSNPGVDQKSRGRSKNGRHSPRHKRILS